MKSWRTPAGLALAALVLLCALYAVALGTGQGLAFDGRSPVARAFAEAHPRFHHLVSDLLRTISIGSLALLGGGMVALAFVRRRPDKVIAVLLLVGGATLTTEALKPLLGHFDPLAGDAQRRLQSSFPSGHATIAMSLALAAVLVTPSSTRFVAALAGATYAAAVGVALVLVNWHYPSDVAGGYLVAAFWAGVSVLTGRWAAAAFESHPRAVLKIAVRPAVAAALLLSLPAGFAALLALSLYRRPDLFTRGALTEHFAAAAAGIVAVALAVVVAFAFVPLERSRDA